MKLVKTLLATTLVFTAFSTFAATDETTQAVEDTDKVIVSTQESPATDSTQEQPPTPPAIEGEADASAPATPAVGQ